MRTEGRRRSAQRCDAPVDRTAGSGDTDAMAQLADVFGIRTVPVLSYVERPNVDGAFARALKTDHHIVIYGSSKQGKTALRQKHLHDNECAVVRTSPRMDTAGLYQPILRDADIRIEAVQVTGSETGTAGSVKTGFKVWIPWVGAADASVEGDAKRSKRTELRSEFIGYDLGEAQSIGELLKEVSFKKYVVLENFHYLPFETQRHLAFDLKTFHEIGLRFIVLGIWRESNRLLTFNNDLQDRVVEIPVEPWLDADLDLVARKGCDALNIEIGPDIIGIFRSNAFGNVGLFQEFLKRYCEECKVFETQSTRHVLTDQEAAQATLKARLDDQRNTLSNTLIGIAARSRTRDDAPDPLLLPYYLARVIARADLDLLRAGVERKALLELLRSIHHRADKASIRPSDVTNLLNRLPSIQADLTPPLLYYDGNARRLRVVDTRQFFVLANVDRTELEEEIPYPLQE